MKKLKIGSFLSVVLTLLVVYAIVKWGIPAISREITTLPFPLPVPGTLMFFYMMLAIIALFLMVTFSEDGLNDFLRPIKKFLRGGYTKILRNIALVAVPALIGWQVTNLLFLVPRCLRRFAFNIRHRIFPRVLRLKRIRLMRRPRTR